MNEMELKQKLGVQVTRAFDKYTKPIKCPKCGQERYYIIQCEKCGDRRN